MLLIPTLLVVAWHLINSRIPTADAINYLDVVREASERIDQGRFADGLWTLYTERGWRPVLFPPVILPAYLATGGNVLLTTAITATLEVSALSFIAFCFIKRFANVWIAVLGAVVIGTNAVVLNYSNLLFADILFLLFGLASFLYLSRAIESADSDDILKAGIFIALAICVRPPEALPLGVVVLTLLLWATVRRKIQWNELIYVVAIPVLNALWVMFLNDLQPYRWAYGLSIPLWGVQLWFAFRYRSRAPYASSALVASTVASIWWLPGYKQLKTWIAANTGQGEVVQSLGLGKVDFTSVIATTIGAWVIPMVLIGALALLLCRRSSFTRLGAALALSAGLFISGTVLLAYATVVPWDGGGDRRALLGNALTVLGLVGIVGASNTRSSRLLLLAGLAVVSLFQTGEVIATLMGRSLVRDFPNLVFHDVFASSTPIPPVRRATESHFAFISKLKTFESHFSLKGKRIFVPNFEMQMEVEPFAAGFAARAMKTSFEVGTLHIPPGVDGIMLLRQWDFVATDAMDDLSDELLAKEPRSTYGKLAKAIIRDIRRTSPQLLEPLTEFQVNGRRFLLLRVLNKLQ